MREWLGAFTCALFACLSVFLFQGAMFLREARLDLDQLTGQTTAALASVQAIETNTTRTEAEMAGLLNQTRHSMITEGQEKALAGDMARLLQDSDESVRKLGIAAGQLGMVAPEASVAIEGIASDSHQALDTFSDTLNAAKVDLASPELRDAMVQTDLAAGNLAAASKSAADGLATTDQVIHKEAEIITAPVSRLKTFAFLVARLAGRFLGF